MGAFVTAGPSNTAVVDNQGMYWMAGKVRLAFMMVSIFTEISAQWKNSGEG